MTSINEINTEVPEGKMLMAAMAIITTECRRDKQPDEVLLEVQALAEEIYKKSTDLAVPETAQ